MKKTVATILLIALSCSLLVCCNKPGNSKAISENEEEIVKDTVAMQIETEGQTLTIILTENRIESGTPHSNLRFRDSLIYDSICWDDSRPHTIKELQPAQKSEFDKIKSNIKRIVYEDPRNVKDGLNYFLYHNGKNIITGNDAHYEEFPPEMQETIASMLKLAGIDNLYSELY